MSEKEWAGTAAELAIKMIKLKTENPVHYEEIKQLGNMPFITNFGPFGLIGLAGSKSPIEFEPGIKTLVPTDMLMAWGMGRGYFSAGSKIVNAARWIFGGGGQGR